MLSQSQEKDEEATWQGYHQAFAYTALVVCQTSPDALWLSAAFAGSGFTSRV